MTAPSISLKDQLLRRRPVTGAPVAHGASDHLKRSIGAFQLTMFGVGATVGTGIFIVLQQAVPKAGPAVLISFVIAGIAAGLSAICYAEMASAVPVSGSTYSYAYTTMGEVVAMGVAACLLLEYGVSMSATAVGWSGYLNKLLDNLFGIQIPHSLTAAPFGETPGIVNLPAMLLIVMCALLLIRGASESAKVNTIMVILKLGVLALFVAVAFTAFTTDHFAGFWDKGFAGITAGAATIFFTFIGLDAVSTAGDEVKDPQRTMPRAIIAALIAVTTHLHPGGVRRPGHAGSRCVRLRRTSRGRAIGHPGECSGRLDLGQHDSRRRCGDLDLLGHARGDVRPDPHPVRDGPRRVASFDVRQGQPAQHDTGEQHDRRGRHHGDPGGLRPHRLPVGPGVDRHPRRLHHGRGRRDHPATPRARPASWLQGSRLSGDTHPVHRRLPVDPVRPAPEHLDLVRDMGGRGVDLLLPLEPTPQRADRRRRRTHPHRGTNGGRSTDPRRRNRRDRRRRLSRGQGRTVAAVSGRRGREDAEDVADGRHSRAASRG